jgi:DNA polymerase III delta prime subunit
MSFQFKKATKTQSRLRMALIGPSGSGKTYTALAIAAHLGNKVAVIDTERGSASKYADKFGFDVLELETFEPSNYVSAIEAAESAGYDVIVLDSLSHAWMGKGGALEQVDLAAKRNKGNSFAGWRDVTPQHNALVDAMLQCRSHLIVTMRTKTEYIIEENQHGKKQPRKIGLAPVQREGLDYEFDVTGELDHDNNLMIDKTRCPELKGKVFQRAGEDIATILRQWLSDGAPAPEVKHAAPAGPPEWFTDLLGRFAAVERDDDLKATQEHAKQFAKQMNESMRAKVIEASNAAKAKLAVTRAAQ